MKKDCDKFLKYCGITAIKSTLKKIEHKINLIDKFFKGKLDNLTLEDLHSFLSYLNEKDYAIATKNDTIKVLKRFLKWKYKEDWNKRFDELKDARINGNSHRKLSKEDLLTEEEMRLIINSMDSFKYKTLFLLFQETSARPEELLKKLLWKEIDFDKEEIKLHSSKTDKTRFIPIHKTIDHLKRYKIECFAVTPRADDRVFNLTNQSVLAFLNKLERKINFSKHLYPYLWRHSILSRMIRKLSPKVYEMYAGHSLETGMKIYAHLDTEDLRKELDEKVYHIKKLTPKEKSEIKKLKEKILQHEERFEIIAKFIVQLGNKVDKKNEWVIGEYPKELLKKH